MPTLGADMAFGTLLEWRVKPGDEVKHGDIVAVVDTSKAEIEVEIFEDGVIDELRVVEGTHVPVGTVLATLRPLGEPSTAGRPPTAAPVVPAGPAATIGKEETATPPEPASEPPVQGHRLHVSPLARRVAEQLGVDLSHLEGSGPGGSITKADVERAAGTAAPTVAERASEIAPPPVPADESANRAAAMRQAIGQLMARSKREIPHYYLQRQIDMSSALGWLQQENLRRPVQERVLPSALLLSAVAGAAASTQAMNGFWVDGALQPAARVHLGVAISLHGGGLIAPAIHDADRKSLDELMAGLRDLVTRARTGRLRGSEMSDSTITVTNLGEHGVDLVHGVIYPPQVALVGFGDIRERPWAEGGMVGSRPVVTATLAADHRASDGHAGARFLTLIERRLQTPEEL